MCSEPGGEGSELALRQSNSIAILSLLHSNVRNFSKELLVKTRFKLMLSTLEKASVAIARSLEDKARSGFDKEFPFLQRVF